MAEPSTVISAFPGVPANRVTGDTWKINPMKNPTLSTWNLPISLSDITKLLGGFQPAEMEDRWMSRADGPDVEGNIVFYMYRSWTGDEQFQLKITMPAPTNTGTANSEYPARIKEIIWDNSPAQPTEEEAKRMAVLVCRGILRCDFQEAS